jgi:hypothetical protein
VIVLSQACCVPTVRRYILRRIVSTVSVASHVSLSSHAWLDRSACACRCRMTRSARKNSRRRSLRRRNGYNCGCGRAHMRQIYRDLHLLARTQSQRAQRRRRRLGTRRPGCDAQKKGIGVLLRATATTSCDPARLEGSGWLQPCRSARPDGCARCPPRAAPALRPLWTGAHPKSRSAAA